MVLRSSNKVGREYDVELYKAHHAIENFFACLKQWRALPIAFAARYDKTARNVLGASIWSLPLFGWVDVRP